MVVAVTPLMLVVILLAVALGVVSSLFASRVRRDRIASTELLRAERAGRERLAASERAERERLERLRAEHVPPASITELDRARLPSTWAPVPFAYLTELRLSGLRCFREETVALRFPGENSGLALPNVNLLLGDNGTGKSTVLRAAAMVALGPVLDSSGFVPYRLVREGRETGVVEGRFAFSGPGGPEALGSRVDLRRRGDFEVVSAETEGPYWDDLFDESSPSFFVVGYGVSRRTAEDSRSDPALERGRRRRRFQRVSSLFDETVGLMPFGSWLPSLDERRRAEVAAVLDRLLPSGVGFADRFDGDEAVFRRGDLAVPLRALSDGFRSYLGWLGDLLFHLTAATPEHVPLGELGGIVLVDEIDLLLHPSWQRVVVPAVAKVFPHVQFILTTHSPLVTGTLEAANILVAKDDEETGSAGLAAIAAEVHGLSAEQVLLSSYFELTSTRAPGAEEDLASLARRAIAGDEDARRRYLAALVDGSTGGPRR